MNYYICSRIVTHQKVTHLQRVRASSHEEALSLFKENHSNYFGFHGLGAYIETKLGRVIRTFPSSSCEDDGWEDEEDEEDYDDDEEEYYDEYDDEYDDDDYHEDDYLS